MQEPKKCDAAPAEVRKNFRDAVLAEVFNYGYLCRENSSPVNAFDQCKRIEGMLDEAAQLAWPDAPPNVTKPAPTMSTLPTHAPDVKAVPGSVTPKAAAIRGLHSEVEQLMAKACDFFGQDEDGHPTCTCCHRDLKEDGTGHSMTCLAQEVARFYEVAQRLFAEALK